MIRVDGPWFRDEHGRRLILRGVNLGGSSKVPTRPNGATHLRDGLFEHRQVSFVGRPFPLDEADEHFRRLRGWGFTILRLLTTWEAIEHRGPGTYDLEYLDYLTAVVRKAGEHGLFVFLDPHQDVWSQDGRSRPPASRSRTCTPPPRHSYTRPMGTRCRA
jgi:hypothetical protein